MQDFSFPIPPEDFGRLAVFCDFDGTLVDIAPTPDAVFLDPVVQSRIYDLSSALDGALAVISGRAISDLERYFPDPALTLIGSHGAEKRQDGILDGPGADIRDLPARIAAGVRSVLGTDPGILIEIKPASVAVHYRAVPQREAEVRDALLQAIAPLRDFQLMEGKKVVEARLAGAHKGAAISTLMGMEPFSGRLPVFIGDDVTDEDGFLAVADAGGFGVKVGEGPTSAPLRIDGVGAVHNLLDNIADGLRHDAGAPAPDIARIRR